MSYKAKSAAAAAAAILLVYGVYFTSTLTHGVQTGGLAAMIAATVALIVLMIVCEAVLALQNRREGAAAVQDERDIAFALKSARNGYYALVCSLVIVPLTALAGGSGLAVCNAVLGVIVLAEVVRFGSRFVYERTGG